MATLSRKKINETINAMNREQEGQSAKAVPTILDSNTKTIKKSQIIKGNSAKNNVSNTNANADTSVKTPTLNEVNTFFDKYKSADYTPKTESTNNTSTGVRHNKTISDKEIIKSYKDTGNYNAVERLFDKDKQRAYNKKSAMTEQYNGAIDRQAEKFLKESGYSLDDVSKASIANNGTAMGNATTLSLTDKDNRVIKAAEQYGLTLQDILDSQAVKATDKMREDVKDYAKEHEVLGTLASLGTNLTNGVVGAYETVNSAIGGNPVGSNRLANNFGSLTNDIRGTVKEEIGADNKVGNFLYDIGTSIGDMSVAALAGGNVGSLPLMGLNAFGSSLQEQKGKDTTDSQKILSAIGAGAIEMLTEKLPLENIFKIASGASKTSTKTLVKNILKQAGAEGTEEFVSDIANSVYDHIINNKESDYWQDVSYYMSQGMNETTAKLKAAQNVVNNAVYSGLAGAVSGGVMGAGASVVGNVNSNKANAKAETVNNANNTISWLEGINNGNINNNVVAEALNNQNAKFGNADVVNNPVVNTNNNVPTYNPNMSADEEYQRAMFEQMNNALNNKHTSSNYGTDEDLNYSLNRQLNEAMSQKAAEDVELANLESEINKLYDEENSARKFDSTFDRQNNYTKDLDSMVDMYGNDDTKALYEELKGTFNNATKSGDILGAIDSVSGILDEIENTLSGKKVKHKGSNPNYEGANHYVTRYSDGDFTNKFMDYLDNYYKYDFNVDYVPSADSDVNIDYNTEEVEETPYLYDNYKDEFTPDLSDPVKKKNIKLPKYNKKGVPFQTNPFDIAPTQKASVPTLKPQADTKNAQTVNVPTVTESALNKPLNNAEMPSVNTVNNVTQNTQNVANANTEINLNREPGQGGDYVAKTAWNTLTETPFIKESERASAEIDDAKKKGDMDVSRKSEVQSVKEATENIAKDKQGVIDRIEKSSVIHDGVETDECMIILNDLVREAEQTGDFTKVREWSKMIKDKAHSLGQALQSFAKYTRTAAGVIAKVDALSEISGKNMTNEDCKAITDLMNQAEKLGDSKEASRLRKQAYAIAAKYLPDATFMQKWNAWRYLAMLGNTRTHIRNIMGNTMFGFVTDIKDNLAGAIESAYDKLGGNIDRKRSVVNRITDADFLGEAKDDFDNSVFDLATKGDKFNIKSELEGEQKVYNSKILNTLVDFNSDLLTAEDNYALKRKYARSLVGFLKANGADVNIFNSTNQADIELLDRARKFAVKEAQISTFHEDNKFAETLTQWSKNAANSDSAAIRALGYGIEALVPFKKTPANVLKQGAWEYNPLVETCRMIKQIKNGADASEFIDSLSKGLTGGGIMALGAWLASKGILKGSANDKEDEFIGEQSYSIKIGDYSYTIDWSAPAALPLFVGCELYKALTNKDEDYDWVDALTSISEPIIETSMLSGLKDTLNAIASGYNSDDKLARGLITFAGNYIGQGVPTIGGQIARTIEPNRITAQTENTGITGAVEYLLRKNANKIPFLGSAINEPYVDEFGNIEQNMGGNILGRALNNFISPGYLSKIDDSEISNNLVDLQKQEDVEKDIIPSLPNRSVNKERLDNKTYTEYKQLVGNYKNELLTSLFNNSTYNNLTNVEKQDLIKDLYTDSGYLGQNDIGITPSDTKAVEMYNKYGVDGYIDYKLIKKLKNRDGADGYDVINSMDMSNEQKGEYLNDILGNANTTKNNKVYAEQGPEMLYNWFSLNKNADEDGNGSLKQSEFADYFNQNEDKQNELLVLGQYIFNDNTKGTWEENMNKAIQESEYYVPMLDANSNASIPVSGNTLSRSKLNEYLKNLR